MPFKISIKVNDRQLLEVVGRNIGPAENDRHRYQYRATDNAGNVISGEVTHNRKSGIARLAGIIAIDISNHQNSPTNAADLLAARIREKG